MREEIAFENGRFSDFQGLVTLTMTLDRVILHTIMHHSSTSTYIPSFIEIEETFCGRTDGRADEHFETHFIRLTRRSRRNKYVGPTHCRAEMYAGRVACCSLVSHDEYADWTDGRTTEASV